MLCSFAWVPCAWKPAVSGLTAASLLDCDAVELAFAELLAERAFLADELVAALLSDEAPLLIVFADDSELAFVISD